MQQIILLARQKSSIVAHEGDANRKGATKTLKLEFDPKAFTSASVPALLVNSH